MRKVWGARYPVNHIVRNVLAVSGAKTILRIRFWAPSVRQTVLCVRFGQFRPTNFNPRKFSQYSGFQIHAAREIWKLFGPQTILCVRFRRLRVARIYAEYGLAAALLWTYYANTMRKLWTKFCEMEISLGITCSRKSSPNWFWQRKTHIPLGTIGSGSQKLIFL